MARVTHNSSRNRGNPPVDTNGGPKGAQGAGARLVEFTAGKEYHTSGNDVSAPARADNHLLQDEPHLAFTSKDSDTYLSSGALGPCVGLFVIFNDNSMVAGHFALEMRNRQAVSSSDPEKDPYLQMLSAITGQISCGGSIQRVIVGGAVKNQTAPHSEENVFPTCMEVRKAVIQDLFAMPQMDGERLTTLWNDGAEGVEIIVNPQTKEVVLYASIPGKPRYREHFITL